MGNFRNRNGRGNSAPFHSSRRPPRRPTFPDPAFAEPAPERQSWKTARAQDEAQDALLGFKPLPPGSAPRVGWLVNMAPGTVEEPLTGRPVQAVDLFFIAEDSDGDFRATIIARPYLYVAAEKEMVREVEIALRKRFPDEVADVTTVFLEDISMPNHLAQDEGRLFLKVETRTMGDLFTVRKTLEPVIRRNNERKKRQAAVDIGMKGEFGTVIDPLDALEDMREYDVAPVNRLAIDKRINVGYWYKVTPGGDDGRRAQDEVDERAFDELHGRGVPAELDPDISERSANDFASARLEKLPDIVERAAPVVLAYDIECTKKPLKFPDPEAGDEVMMISWMLDGKGYLGINRTVVSKDIDNFEYKPHPEFKGSFEVFNEPDEKSLLERFFSEIRIAAPRVFATFNGDYFDWPFVEKRAAILGIDMANEIGMRSNDDEISTKETRGRAAIHMDVFHWVNRDSYLPQGSRGLKAVTRALLGFEPEEIPPEEMVHAAIERPDEMAKYSVSDAVCTYHLYMKYVHPFIFSLCNIIPLNPDDVLRKGSGTLCEMLLMCQAKEKRIVAPNKYMGSAVGKLTDDGHVLESETYIGGHVEAIRTGVFRSDLPLDFTIDINALDDLQSSLDDTLKFAITVEGKMKMDDVTNYEEVRADIVRQLDGLRRKLQFREKPLIYHLDVSAMYPNIILTNRLQPHAIVTPAQCAACDFNGVSECQRDMEWTWRGEFYPASRGEAQMIQRRVAQEEREKEMMAAEEAQRVAALNARRDARGFNWNRSEGADGKSKISRRASAIANFDSEEARKDVTFRRRLKKYCQTNYRRTQETRVVSKTATVCQRENPFYVDTVRAFRDRRYEYKGLLKKQKKLRNAAKESEDPEAIEKAEKLVVLYDSLQLAHKCILNSFYGYVMRKGARWYSMEMAGIVTNTGGLIIRRAREFIDKVGLPLELDTDGIWCALPTSFPEKFTFKTTTGKDYTINYVCSVFNADVAANFTNHHYQDLIDPETFEYEQRSECSIFFEVDGPYKAMVLPASLEEGKSIKKRYAVFNPDGSLAELKGFEIKRRGELKLIKEFQGEIFDRFLQGTTISQCYQKVGETCNKWLDILTTRGKGMSDSQLLELLVEQNNMSKPLDEYLAAGQKSCAITCAGRMREFLGDAITRDKGLATTYIVARKPEEEQVTTRAIPVKIFDFPNEVVRTKLLKKWTKNPDGGSLQLRNLLDWDYYKGRLANAVLKIVSIPAALQAVDNPVPRIEYPPWLVKKCRELKDFRKQRTVLSYFQKLGKGEKFNILGMKLLQDSTNDTEKLSIEDIEDLPIRSWTAAQIAHRQAKAVIIRRKREERKTLRFASTDVDITLRSNAADPYSREEDARETLIRLYCRNRPDKRTDYAGWVRHAKRIWKAQRTVRVLRYVGKRARSGEMANADSLNDDGVEETQVETRLGGKPFAVRFGGLEKKEKRRKLYGDFTLDYAPENFVADVMQSPVARRSRNFFSTKRAPLVGPGVIWQNIAVTQVLDRPGKYRLWVLPVRKDAGKFVTGNLHSVPLHVSRVLYYNSRVQATPDIPGVACELVNGLTLPRSRETQYLFRLEMHEDRFQRSDKDLTSVLTDAAVVDGVFGTKAPLEYEIILKLGTLCAPRKAAISGMSQVDLLREGMHIDDVVAKSPDTVPYLQESLKENTNTVLNQAFLYGSHAIDGSSRALYVVVAPAAKLVHAIIVTLGKDLNINVKRTWKRVSEERKKVIEASALTGGENRCEEPRLPPDTVFTSSAVVTRSEAWSEIQHVLSNLRSSSSISERTRVTGLRTILLAQWPDSDVKTAEESIFGEGKNASRLPKVSSGTLEGCVPVVNSYPVVRLSNNVEDGNYMPVGWETRAITVALTRFAEVSNWLSSHVQVARFAGIPLGNVSSADIHAQALDVLVGRELSNRDHVLWASSCPKPDLGGFEEDEVNLLHEIPYVPEVSVPGSYRTVCVDTELSNLAIATILSSSHVNQLEGTDLAFDAAANTAAQRSGKGVADGDLAREGTIGGKNAAPLDEMASSAPAFRALKDLVTSWDKAASNVASPETANIARSLLDHLLRWTRSESALLYDPALARFLGWLIKKVFRQLVGELQSLGATIVFASLSRLILATPKTQTLDGLRYAGFLEKTVKGKPLFRHVHFEPLMGIYASLLFVDRFNYCALPAPEEALILSGEFGRTASQKVGVNRIAASRDIPYARMTWDIARYLPVPVAVLWTQVVEEFVRRPMVLRLRMIEQETESPGELFEESGKDILGSAENAETYLKKRQRRPRGDGFAEEVLGFTKSLSGQLLEKVHEIREKTPTLVFPDVPSVFKFYDHRRNPALEFVRTMCHVLGLDSSAAEEVAGMRRSLLRLLGVREFAKEALFTDPALPVPLRDLICSFCNAVVDLDVARDARLWTEKEIEDSENDGTQSSKPFWACEYCGNHYDMRQIELGLTRDAQKLYTAYQVQDLVCRKCNMVKRENMTTHCNCSGTRFQLTVGREGFHKQLYALKSVAEFHRFEFLLETVSWMVESTRNDF